MLSRLIGTLPSPAMLAGFLRLSRSRVEAIDRTLRVLATHKRWLDAEAFIVTHGLRPEDVKSPWLVTLIRQCAAHRGVVASAAAFRQRVAGLPGSHELLATQPMSGGLSNLAMFLHSVRSPDGRVHSIVEKVYLAQRRRRVAREACLFSEIDHRRLLAPAFLGTVEGDGLVSIFHAHVAGRAPSRRGFASMRNELVAALWHAAPTLNLATVMGGPKLRGRGSESLDSAPARIHSRLASTGPDGAFVLHRDLHAANCLRRPDGSHVLIDWDGFELAPVGFGLALAPQHFGSEQFRQWLARKLPAAAGLPLEMALENIAIDQLLRCEGKGDAAGVQAWARELR